MLFHMDMDRICGTTLFETPVVAAKCSWVGFLGDMLRNNASERLGNDAEFTADFTQSSDWNNYADMVVSTAYSPRMTLPIIRYGNDDHSPYQSS